MRGNCTVDRLHHRDWGGFPCLHQRCISILSHCEELSLMLSWYTHQSRQRSQMLTLSLGHLLREILEVDGGKHVRLFLSPHLTIVLTAEDSSGNPKCLPWKDRVIRCRN